MRSLLGIFFTLAVIGPIALAQNDPLVDLFEAPVAKKPQENPFEIAEKSLEKEKAEKVRSTTIQATLVYENFELEQADWFSWTSNPENSIRGPELRAHVQQLLENGDAALAQLALIRSKHGRLKSESVDAVIYPSEYDYDKFQALEDNFEQQLEDWAKPLLKVSIGPLEPGTFKTGRAGVTFEADLRVEAFKDTWSLSLNPEWVRPNGGNGFGHGIGEVEIPTFNTQRLTMTTTGFASGETRFIGSAQAPFSIDGSRKNPVCLSFIRLDAHDLKKTPVAEPETFKFHATPQDLSILMEWIEMEQADFGEILGKNGIDLGSEAVRIEVAKLIEADKARIVEASAGPVELGERQKFEAIDEFIYPSQFYPPEFSDEGELLVEPLPSATETRNLGFAIELTPRSGPDGSGIHLDLEFEHGALNQLLLWGPPEWKVEWPEFHTARSRQTIWIPFGKRRLISSFELQRDEDSPFEDPRTLVFARVNAGRVIPDPQRENAKPEPFAVAQPGFVFEVFETTQKHLDELIVGGISTAGAELRNRLAEAGPAIETVFQTTTSGNRAKVESIDEYIYPEEYDPPYEVIETKIVVPPNPYHFETQNLGLTIECEPVISHDGWIDLAFQGEFVELTGLREYYKKEATMKVPDFHIQRLTQTVLLSPGTTALLGTTRPPADPKNPDAIRVWFVRGEILQIPNEP